MKFKKVTITRDYVFTQKELKEKLGMKGNIKEFNLFKGLSPDEEHRNVSEDKV